MNTSTLFARAIDVASCDVICTRCGLRATITCSAFGLFDAVVVQWGDCECGVFPIEEVLGKCDDRTIRETLSLLGYIPPRSNS